MALQDRLGAALLKIVAKAPTTFQTWLARKDKRVQDMPASQAAILALMNGVRQPPFAEQPIGQLRGGLRAFADAMDTGWPKGVGVSRSSIQTGHGPRDIEISHPPISPRGIILYFHGGGWALGGIETHRPVCRQLAQETGCKVMSLDYSLAPEAPYPAGVDDCWDAYLHLRAQNPDLPILCAGDSAGGNLAAVMAVRAICRKTKVPDALLLIYPSTDLALNSRSMEAFAEGYFLTREAMDYFRQHYLPDQERMSEPEVSPAKFDRLSKFPPTWVGTAGYDPLKDDGEAFVAKLTSLGVSVDHRHDATLIHGYCQMVGPVRQARAAISSAACFAKAVLDGQEVPKKTTQKSG